MDPNQTLRDALNALHDQDNDAARDALASLLDWLNMGGFLPDVRHHENLYIIGK